MSQTSIMVTGTSSPAPVDRPSAGANSAQAAQHQADQAFDDVLSRERQAASSATQADQVKKSSEAKDQAQAAEHRANGHHARLAPPPPPPAPSSSATTTPVPAPPMDLRARVAEPSNLSAPPPTPAPVAVADAAAPTVASDAKASSSPPPDALPLTVASTSARSSAAAMPAATAPAPTDPTPAPPASPGGRVAPLDHLATTPSAATPSPSPAPVPVVPPAVADVASVKEHAAPLVNVTATSPSTPSGDVAAAAFGASSTSGQMATRQVSPPSPTEQTFSLTSRVDTPGLAAMITRPLAKGNGEYSVTVSLHPPQLGEVRALVSVKGDTLQVTITPDKQIGHAALEASLSDLREQLSQHGGQVDVQLGQPGSDGGRRSPGGQRAVGLAVSSTVAAAGPVPVPLEAGRIRLVL